MELVLSSLPIIEERYPGLFLKYYDIGSETEDLGDIFKDFEKISSNPLRNTS